MAYKCINYVRTDERDMHHVGAFNKFKQYLIISRREYIFSAGIPIGGITVLLAISSFSELFSKIYFILVGCFVLNLSNFIGSKINCLSDYESDKNYEREGIVNKSRFPRAIDSIGRNNVTRIIVVEMFITFSIITWLVLELSKIILLELWLFGVVLAIAYSVKPLRFKGRGLLNTITLTLILYVLPVTFVYLIIRDSMSFFHFLVLSGFGIQVSTLILENELEDYPEDKAANDRNPCVRWGPKKTAYVGLLLTVLSALFLITVLFAVLKYSYMFIPLFIVCYSYVFYKFYVMYKLCSEYESTEREEIMIKIKKTGSALPTWLFWIGFPLLLTLLINLLGV